ncbi:MAG TPA: hypothetical protein VH120_15795, partial [Gemmataceae bacterium]|nr:hypothetical protein [Gemmataceae bacterium]
MVVIADDKTAVGLPMVAEVKPAADATGTRTEIDLIAYDKNRFRLKALAEGLVNQTYQPPRKGLMRTVSDLREGELVLAFGLVHEVAAADKDHAHPTITFEANPLDGSAPRNLTSGVRGVIRCLPFERGEQTREGPTVGRAVVRTVGGAEIPVWWNTLLTGVPDPIPYDADVMTFGTPAVAAETISLWEKPKDTDTDKGPVTALATDLIAKWANWCLTVKMPGEADDADQPAPGTRLPFEIRCDRDHKAVGWDNEARYGPWKMTPLRFGEKYEFLLRRVDLAGNHLYDEPEALKTVGKEAVRCLEPLACDDPAVQALKLPTGSGHFERADLPHSAPLAYPVCRPRPVWAPAEDPAEPKPDTRCLALAAFKREPLLVLFSDVFGRVDPIADDAGLSLLPPPAAVETVLMHGLLDRDDPTAVAATIRRHEDYLAHRVLGVAGGGQLNYFGDPQVCKLRLDFVYPQSDSPGTLTTPGHMLIEAGVFVRWPAACPIELRIVPPPPNGTGESRGGAPVRAATTAKLAEQCTMAVGPTQSGPVVHAVMPPGGYGAARVLP